jgi:hypothetical protein
MRSASTPLACALALGLAVLAGCTNPNDIGVQDYGSVTVHCVRYSDGSPVSGANVRGGGLAASSDANGIAQFPQVPVGPQQFIAEAPGLEGTQTVTIKQGANPDVTVQMKPH